MKSTKDWKLSPELSERKKNKIPIFLNTIFIILAIFYSTDFLAAGEIRSSKPSIPDSASIQIIILEGGSQLIGRITQIGETEVNFESDIGQITIPLTKIREIREVPASSIKNGVYWFPNPNQTRLYFAPTGRMLKRGQGYFSDYLLFFPGFSFGLSDNFTIGGGMSLIPGVSIEKQAFYFTPKIGLTASTNTSLALGALIISIPGDIGDEDIPTFGIAYGVSTFGGPDGSLSAGLGFGFADGDFAKKPVFMVGGEKRFIRRLSFVTENWIFPGVDNPLISYGLRFFGDKLSVDLGFFNTLGGNAIFPGIPWIDFVINFH